MQVGEDEVVSARRMMRRGRSMKEAARSLGIIPSSALDLALWKYIGIDDDDLVSLRYLRPEPMW